MTKPNRHEEIMQFIEQKYREKGYPPSMSEIAAHLGLSAKSNIYKQLRQLEAEGRVVNSGGRYVPAAISEKGRAADVVVVPLIGTVAGGRPILAVENLEGYVAYLPRFGDGRDLFALRVKGESMMEAGIGDGDIVIVDKTPAAENGDIVVAMVDGEATVKTFYRENGHIRLQPQNHAMEPILVTDVTILGRVVASMKYH